MNIKEFLQNNILVLDGGMGTLLQERGLMPGEIPEEWNLRHPEAITEIHKAYFDAGSHVVNTNTFGANLLKFSPEKLREVIFAAVENAKRAKEASTRQGEKYISLDLGPTGKLLKPYGDLDFEDAVQIFAETVKIGVEAGVDLISIETMNDSYETKAALLACKENASLPVFVSNAFGADGKLLTGASPAAMTALLEGMGADAIGLNCSLGPRALGGVLEEFLREASVPVLMKPNAGLPHTEGEKTVFDISPAEFAAEMAEAVKRGARIVGGCCGTTPLHIAALVDAIRDLPTVPILPKNNTVISSYTKAVQFGSSPILIGERINPTGKKRLKQALIEEDMDYLLGEGIAQQDKGVHVLDVNVGIPQIDEATLLPKAVCQLQAVVELPLQIDTADPIAMEAALRRYNGKAMVNSVNGKAESMDAIFPLIRKYGGLLVALTLDENGIPETAEGRVAIAKKILARAKEYGIQGKDLIFDPLAMTVSADQNAAKTTLRAVRMIREELGCHVSLGVSNVSFGLPCRDSVNSTFFAATLANGLSAAIMNPNATGMMQTYYAFRALDGQDENCADFVRFSETLPAQAAAAPTAQTPADPLIGGSDLQNAILSGRKERAAEITRSLVQKEPPLLPMERDIIPALDKVGRGYEEKKVYLPQLLMSAEAAKAAFAVIREAMETISSEKATKGGTILLATVQGDIHDIGKNIVKLLLENYGFPVRDLGKDVSPEAVVAAVEKWDATLVGLSALMTTTVPAMEKTISLLRAAHPHCRIMVGGAVLTKDYAEKIGADAYCKDAMAAVRYAEGLAAEKA